MRRCASCQAENPADASFCTHCGALLEAPAKPPAQPNQYAATLVDQPTFKLDTIAPKSTLKLAYSDTRPNADLANKTATETMVASNLFLPLEPDSSDGSNIEDFAGVLPSAEIADDPTRANASQDPLLGRVIAGKFKIESLLGVGGMGRVYQARHLVLEKIIALKVLHPQYASDDTLVHRFQREARAASRIEHPNIIQIFDFGQESDGTLYMAMELLRGPDLEKIILAEAPMPEKRLARIAMQIASALGEAHRQGVVHRDLKPANIVLLDRAEHRDFVKLFDFGIAKLEQNRGHESRILTTGGVVCGTPEFMSPEQVRGGHLDGRSDLYALGVALYQMATAQFPLEAKNPIDTAAMQVTTEVKSPRTLRADISTALEEIIMRLLQKKPDARYPDAHALFKDLSQIASGEISADLRSEEITTDTLMHPTPAMQIRNDNAATEQIASSDPQASAAAQHNEQDNLLSDEDKLQETKAPRQNERDDEDLDFKPGRSWRGHPLLLPVIALLFGLTLAALTFGLWPHFSNGTSELQTKAIHEKSSSDLAKKAALNENSKTAKEPETAPSAQAHIKTQASEVTVVTPNKSATARTPKKSSAAHRTKKRTKSSAGIGAARVSNNGRLNRHLAKLLRMGDIRYEAGDYVSAIHYYEKAAVMAPEQSKVQRRLTMGYFNQGQADKACIALKHFLRLQPHPPGEDYYQEILANGCHQ